MKGYFRTCESCHVTAAHTGLASELKGALQGEPCIVLSSAPPRGPAARARALAREREALADEYAQAFLSSLASTDLVLEDAPQALLVRQAGKPDRQVSVNLGLQAWDEACAEAAGATGKEWTFALQGDGSALVRVYPDREAGDTWQAWQAQVSPV